MVCNHSAEFHAPPPPHPSSHQEAEPILLAELTFYLQIYNWLRTESVLGRMTQKHNAIPGYNGKIKLCALQLY